MWPFIEMTIAAVTLGSFEVDTPIFIHCFFLRVVMARAGYKLIGSPVFHRVTNKRPFTLTFITMVILVCDDKLISNLPLNRGRKPELCVY